MRFVLAFLAALSMASLAYAEEYEKGPNGGLMLDVAGIDAELLTSGNSVTQRLCEATSPKPVSTNGYTAAVLIVSGANREPLNPDAIGREQLERRGEEADPTRCDDHADDQDCRGQVRPSQIQEIETRDAVRDSGRATDGLLNYTTMKDLALAPSSTFASVRCVLTDMDETLTYRGRLSARTYDGLERLQRAGVKVIPVTAAPAGWCDQMARMWPVDGVISENGGLFLQRDGERGVIRRFWHGDAKRQAIADQLAVIGRHIRQVIPSAIFADDQPFRLTSLAFAQPDSEADRQVLVAAMRKAGLDVAVNNLWILGWIGASDKLAMARRAMADAYNINIDADPDAVLYCGDSTNDAPMFGFFRHTVGVSNVRRYLSEIAVPPNWITKGPGGDGFVEVADAVIAGKTCVS
jgi:HAD superfamily hydrolase (TIGR01484 family)